MTPEKNSYVSECPWYLANFQFGCQSVLAEIKRPTRNVNVVFLGTDKSPAYIKPTINFRAEIKFLHDDVRARYGESQWGKTLTQGSTNMTNRVQRGRREVRRFLTTNHQPLSPQISINVALARRLVALFILAVDVVEHKTDSQCRLEVEPRPRHWCKSPKS
jgi:hypothetical protein